jgi:hypothetical protein
MTTSIENRTKVPRSFTAFAEREGRWWIVTIRELDRVTQARRLEQVEPMARDLIALWLEVDPTSFDITVIPLLPEALNEEILQARQLRAEADKLAEEASERSRDAARHLADAGLPLRDVGVVLGVSFQRAGQLVGRR